MHGAYFNACCQYLYTFDELTNEQTSLTLNASGSAAMCAWITAISCAISSSGGTSMYSCETAAAARACFHAKTLIQPLAEAAAAAQEEPTSTNCTKAAAA
jgi:hypothetical protein